MCSATSQPSTQPNQRAFFFWSANAAKTRAGDDASRRSMTKVSCCADVVFMIVSVASLS